jgi:hypothetical protein
MPSRPPPRRSEVPLHVRLVAVTAAAVALAACASSPAQRAFDQGEYGSAAKLADDDVKARPGDEGAVALRQRAREREVELRCANLDTILRGGRSGDALGMLEILLSEIGDWGGIDRLSPALRARLAVSTNRATRFVTNLADAAPQPLAAELAVERGAAGELPRPLADARQEARSRVRASGQKNCARLRATAPPEAPSWNLVVARYCAHFGQGDAPPIPDAAPAACDGARTVEAAARCASRGAATPGTLALLAQALGEKAELLPAVVGPPPALRAARPAGEQP